MKVLKARNEGNTKKKLKNKEAKIVFRDSK